MQSNRHKQEAGERSRARLTNERHIENWILVSTSKQAGPLKRVHLAPSRASKQPIYANKTAKRIQSIEPLTPNSERSDIGEACACARAHGAHNVNQNWISL